MVKIVCVKRKSKLSPFEYWEWITDERNVHTRRESVDNFNEFMKQQYGFTLKSNKNLKEFVFDDSKSFFEIKFDMKYQRRKAIRKECLLEYVDLASLQYRPSILFPEDNLAF